MANSRIWGLEGAEQLEFFSLRNSKHDESTIQRWSSLIGIITALVGNVLISFALNIQRYAHIRLSKERYDLEHETKQTTSQHESRTRKGNNGHQQIYRDRRGVTNSYNVDTDVDDAVSNSGTSSNGLTSADDTTANGNDPSMGQRNSQSPRKTYLQSPYWWAGLLLMTIGESGNFLAYGFAPASIVSPLGVVALISNCIIAPFMLKERFRQRDFWGVMIAIAGAVIVALSAKSSESKLGPHEIWKAITQLAFIIYMVVTITFIAILLWASGRYGKRTVLIDLGLVALFGAYTVLATKGVSSLLSFTLWRMLTYPLTYLLLAVLIASAMLQIRYLNKALQRFDSTQVIPIQFVLFTISVIIGSSVLYRDFRSAGVDQEIKFVAGCLCTFFGVYLITSGRKVGEESDEQYARDEGDEETIRLLEEGNVDAEEENSKWARNHRDRPHSGSRDSSRRSRQHKDYLDEPSGSSSSLRNPHTPQRTPSGIGQPPSIIVTPHSEDASENTPLLNNVWNDLAEDNRPVQVRDKLKSTQSSPAVPLQPQEQIQPLTPVRTTPQSQVSISQETSRRRTSISRILPGPLFSLSSPLSGVVADSLRRGFDVTPTKRSDMGILRHSLRGAVVGSARASRNLRRSRASRNSESDQTVDDSPQPLDSLRSRQRGRNTPESSTSPQRSLAAILRGVFGGNKADDDSS